LCWSEEHVLDNIYRYEYYWCDGVNYKRPTKLPATQYIELLMEWVETQINNEDIFPQTVGMACVHFYVSLLAGFFLLQKTFISFTTDIILVVVTVIIISGLLHLKDPLPSSRLHLSHEDKRENGKKSSVLCCVRQLYTMISTHVSSS